MKFQYGQSVMVTNGFYKGLKGFVMKFEKPDTETGYIKYHVIMKGSKETKYFTPEDWILENDLRIDE